MSTVCKTEALVGTIITNPAALGAAAALDLTSLFPANAYIPLKGFTVYNDTDRPIKVSYINTGTSRTDFFFVPNGGKAFSHRLQKGDIQAVSFIVSSHDATLATGRVVINLEA